MVVPVGDITLNSYYDSTNGKQTSGAPMAMSENMGLGSWRYYGNGWEFINLLKGGQSNEDGGSTNVTAPYVRDVNGYYDTTGGGQWNPLVGGGSERRPYNPSGDFVLRWVGTSSYYWALRAETYCTEGSQTNTLIAGQTEADFDNSPTTEGTFVGGTSGTYSVGEVITLNSGALVTIDAVSAGVVTQFTIDKGNGTLRPAAGDDGTQVIGTPDAQASVSAGTGLGFSLTPDGLNILHRIPYTVTGNNRALGGTVRNDGGGSGTCTRLELLQPGNETRFDAGNIMALQWLADNAFISDLRCMGWVGTNNSFYSTVDDSPKFDEAIWENVPFQACCYAANELATYRAAPVSFWLNVPHQYLDVPTGSTTELASLLSNIDTWLDPGNDLLVEYSNETWNSASAFADQNKWTERGDVAVQEGTIVIATATVTTSTPHGLSSGDQIDCYGMRAHRPKGTSNSTYYPYAAGGRPFVIVDSATTFRFSPSSDAALGLTASSGGTPEDVTDSGGDDYIASWDTATDTSFTTPRTLTDIRFKDAPSSTENQNTGHAKLSVKLWEVADAQVTSGRNVYAVMCGQRTNTGVIGGRINIAGVRDRVDYTGPAFYYRFLEGILDGADSSWGKMSWLVNGQDETWFDGTIRVRDGETEAEYTNSYGTTSFDSGVIGFNGGTGWIAGDVAKTITLSDGIVITIDAVAGGEVTEFTVDASGDTGSPHSWNTTLTQVSTTGTGSEFTLSLGKYNIARNGVFAAGSGHAVNDVITLSPTWTADFANNELNGLAYLLQPWVDSIQLATTGTLPAPLQTGTDYYVTTENYNQGGDTCSLALTPGGPAIELTDAGTGTHYLANAPTATVNAVSAGAVTEFTLTVSSDYGHHNTDTVIPQAVTTGSGTGFSITPRSANITVAPGTTTTNARTYLTDINIPRIVRDVLAHIDAVGRENLVSYEGYDAEGTKIWTYEVRSIGEFIIDWGRSADRRTFVAQFTREFANLDCKLNSHHSFIADLDETGAWGRLEFAGDHTHPEHQGLLDVLSSDDKVYRE